MPLTTLELVAAITRAESFPAGHGGSFLTEGRVNNNKTAAALLKQDPTLIRYGCPGVVVAGLRGDLSARGLYQAFADVAEVYSPKDKTLNREKFSRALDQNPQRVAKKLRKALLL